MNACLDLMKALDQDVGLDRMPQSIAGSKTMSFSLPWHVLPLCVVIDTAEQFAIKLLSITQLDGVWPDRRPFHHSLSSMCFAGSIELQLNRCSCMQMSPAEPLNRPSQEDQAPSDTKASSTGNANDLVSNLPVALCRASDIDMRICYVFL